MSTGHGITLDEQIEWIEERACDAVSRAGIAKRWHSSKVADVYREDAAMFLTVANTLRAAQVSVVSPPPARMAGSPLGPSGPGGFYPGD